MPAQLYVQSAVYVEALFSLQRDLSTVVLVCFTDDGASQHRSTSILFPSRRMWSSYDKIN